MGLVSEFESRYWSLGLEVLGIDEAGRGPLAGPCVVAGVVLPLNYHNDMINDSKTLSAKKREALYDEIMSAALRYEIYVVSLEEIETYNIYQATKRGMERICEILQSDVVLADAMDLSIDRESHAIIKGDQRSLSIAAASILAKVHRDRLMMAYAKEYPEYGFDKHKGYGTKLHKEMIIKYGRCPIHRRDFRFKDEEQLSLDL